jgi:hypothetical protein
MESVAGHARGIVDAGILAEGMKLERELNAANERIKRLEEAGDALGNNHNPFTYIDWLKAKEAKP